MTQAEAIKIMNSGANVFLTGPPGSGKTFVLNEFIEEAEQNGKSVAITASTGMAASHIGGVTIHSWSGLGISEMITKDDLRKAKNNNRLVKRIRNASTLVIDEVSMLHGHRLDMVNVLTKHLRDSREPFGGMQVILVGDLFQLPPVSRDTTELDFAHLSNSWEELGLKICYLTEQHRQEGNDLLLEILQAMRSNAVSETHLKLLQNRIVETNSETVTKLYSHNIDVDAINWAHLDALPGKVKRFSMIVDGDKYRREALVKNILAPQQLELKVGAEVMFVANDFKAGFFNGTRGKITRFAKSGDPIVKLKSGRTFAVGMHTWAIKEDDRVIASAEQIPLRLAWAITIHKSQGMSLDAANVDLSKAFTPGMGYVALSRVRSLDGLYLQGINDMALLMHEQIYGFDAQLREASELLSNAKENQNA
jgi:ATP-dependent DNA helicase PIF1